MDRSRRTSKDRGTKLLQKYIQDRQLERRKLKIATFLSGVAGEAADCSDTPTVLHVPKILMYDSRFVSSFGIL